MRILVVEDNNKLASGLSAVLTADGYLVDWVADGAAADAAIAVQAFDAIILDLTLPDMDGLDVLRTLRANNVETPVLILTARGDLDDRVKGLDLGADDYLTKPFEVSELEARVRVLLRRHAGRATSTVDFGPLALDITDNALTVNGSAIDVSSRELSVLRVIMMARGRIVAKGQIAESLSTFESGLSDNAVEQTISRLRRKLQPFGIGIRTARGLGYYLFQEDALE